MKRTINIGNGRDDKIVVRKSERLSIAVPVTSRIFTRLIWQAAIVPGEHRIRK